VIHPIGSAERPLSDQDVEAKVRDLVRHGEFRGSIDDVIAAVWRLDTMETIAPLIGLLKRGD
jgi:2-methylcitrate dehydratase PrpD